MAGELLYETHPNPSSPGHAYAIYGVTYDRAGMVYFGGQTFTSQVRHICTHVKLYMSKYGSPGTVTVALRETSSGLPTGPNLTSGTFDGNALTGGAWDGQWVTTTFSTVVIVEYNIMYAIVVSAPDGSYGNDIRILMEDAPNPMYSGGTAIYKPVSQADSNWALSSTYDVYFEEYGLAVPPGAVDNPIAGGTAGRILEWPYGLRSHGFGLGTRGVPALERRRKVGWQYG